MKIQEKRCISRLNKIENWIRNREAKSPPKTQRKRIKVPNNDRKDGKCGKQRRKVKTKI